jgi:hypothetical protein
MGYKELHEFQGVRELEFLRAWISKVITIWEDLRKEERYSCDWRRRTRNIFFCWETETRKRGFVYSKRPSTNGFIISKLKDCADVKLSFSCAWLIKRYSIRMYGGSGCIDPSFLELGSRWRWVISYTPGQLNTPGGKSPLYLFHRSLRGPQSPGWTTWSRPYRDSNFEPSVVQPVASRCTDWASFFYMIGIRRADHVAPSIRTSWH